MARQDRIGKTATCVYTDSDGSLCVRYHRTVVWKLSADRKTVTLNTGGWRTVTTKARMNQAFRQLLPSSRMYVFQKAGDWFVGKHRQDFEHSVVANFDDESLDVSVAFAIAEAA